MRQVFLYSGDSLSVYVWQDKNLKLDFCFQNTEQHKDMFVEFIKSSDRLPAQLLIDIADEDFRYETIPHVSGREKNRVIKRIIQRRYREYRYHHAEMSSQEKTSRKEDNYVIAAAHEDAHLNEWVELLKAYEVPLAGIWSLSLLTNKIVDSLSCMEENQLIVYLNLDLSVRETFFKNHHVMLSRKNRLNLESASLAEIFSRHINSNTDSIRRYLANNHLIGFNDVLKTYCIVPDVMHAEVEKKLAESELIKFEVISDEKLSRELGLKNIGGNFINAILSYQCSKCRFNRCHYGSDDERVDYKKYRLKNWVNKLTSLGVLASFFAIAIFVMHGLEKKSRAIQVEQFSQHLVSLYDQHYGQVDYALTDAGLVNETLKLAEKVQAHSFYMPQNYFAPLSAVYSDSRFDAVSLTELKWTIYDHENLQQLLQKHVGTMDEDSAYEEQQQGLHPILELVGKITDDNLDYRQSVVKIEAFSDSIAQLEAVDKVIVVKQPIDVRKKSKFSDTKNRSKDSAGANDENLRYKLILVLKAIDSEKA